MATYYWVGGAGTWDATTTTNWALSSGGAGSAGVPTAADDVFFDNASNATPYTVTVNTAVAFKDISISGPGASGNVTVSLGTAAVLNCYGSWVNGLRVAFSTTANSLINFLATSTGKLVATNGVALGSVSVTFIGVGGGWALDTAFTSTGAFNVTAGTFSTGANYSLTAASFISGGTATKSITLNASVVTLTASGGFQFTTTTNLTFDSGTSTIICSSTSPTFNGNGQTFYNVSFTNAATGTTTVNGSSVFNNLTQFTPTNRRVVSVSANQTVNGTLTIGATNLYNRRIQFFSATIGSPVTITAASVATLADVDFRDIVAAGASGTWSGTRLGNGLGNNNITFVAGKTVYWNLAAGGNWNANAWALSSGGAVATANFPLAQDVVVIDNTGLTAGNTITLDNAWWIGTINCTRTAAWTFASGIIIPNFFGNFTIPSVTTLTGTGTWNFTIQGATSTITTNGAALTVPLTFNCPNGTVLLNGALTTANTATVTLTAGTLNLASYTFTCGLFSSNNGNTRVIAFGSGSFAITGSNATVFSINTVAGFSVTGTSLVELITAATTGTRTINLAAFAEENAISLKVSAGSDTVVFATTSGAFKNVNFTGFSGTFNTANSVFVYGDWHWGGVTSNISNHPIAFVASSGTKTITSNGVSFNVGVTFNSSSSGATFQLQDGMATINTTLIKGTIDLNSYTLTTTLFNSSYSNSRAIMFNNGRIVVTGSTWNTGDSTNLTTDASGTISMSSESAKVFNGGDRSWGKLENSGAGALTITESNTFTEISNSVTPAFFVFTAGTTTSAYSFNLNGIASNLVSLRSSNPGSQYTLAKL